MAWFSPGQGLNSIRWRFATAGGVLTWLGLIARDGWLGRLGDAPASAWASLGLIVVLISAAIYWMASRLTALIDALRRSTEAVASGDFDAPVDVDCACEIGGLASSFRKMTSRLNANVLRINLLAHTDPITGLPNRSLIDHLLGYALAPQRRGEFSAAILFIDLDGFKRINDTLGHDAGDELLRLTALRLLQRGLCHELDRIDTCLDAFGNPCERLPENVVFARFAGDEFVAILPRQTDRAELAAIGERIVGALAEPFRIKNQDVRVGASVGIAITPDDTCDASELLAFADQAMYRSKQAGKARYSFFDMQVRERMLDAARTEAELRLALERRELRLHFQPKVGLTDHQLHGTEALVRWEHPRRGLLPPSEFVDLAERCGLMASLGRQVLEMAVAQCRVWLDQGQPLVVAINVSPSQFVEPGFVDHVLTTLQRAGVPAQWLSIEITESMAMQDFEATIERLGQLRAAGVRIALDDFGIGFSNLSQLSRLPLDMLKIDRSLVTGIGHARKSEAIVRAIIGMSHALGCFAIAEGIESEAELNFLRGLHCDCGQGYWFARPMPAEALALWRAKEHPAEQAALA